MKSAYISYTFSLDGTYVPNTTLSIENQEDIDDFLSSLQSIPRYITVNLNIDGVVEKKEFDNFNEFIRYRFHNDLTFRFIEYTNNRKELAFMNVIFDKLERKISIFRDYRDVATGWHIYFNSKDNIVIHDKFFPTLTKHRYLKNYSLLKDTDFYVGISILIYVISNTEKLFFDDILPILRNQISQISKTYKKTD